MISALLHKNFEQKACLIKLQKLSEVGLNIHTAHRAWMFTAIKQTQAELNQINYELLVMHLSRYKPFTALKFAPSKHV